MSFWSRLKDSFSGGSSSSRDDSSSAALVNGLFNVGFNYWNNYEQRKSAKKAYERNIALWSLQNEYNDPSAQMDRLQKAGLNPNLVYGGGATTLSASTHAASPSTITPYQMDALSAVSAYQDIRQKDATTENIKAQNQTIHAQKKLTEAQTAEAEARTVKTQVDTVNNQSSNPNDSIVVRTADGVFKRVSDSLGNFPIPLKSMYSMYKGDGKKHKWVPW